MNTDMLLLLLVFSIFTSLHVYPQSTDQSIQPVSTASVNTVSEETTQRTPSTIYHYSTTVTAHDSTAPFSTITSATETPTSLATESSAGFGNTTTSAAEHKDFWLIMMAATSGGIFITGLVGICLCCCTRKIPQKKSPVKPCVASANKTADDTEENEELSKENKDEFYHVYCSISDVFTECQSII